jgi:dTMP kinase
MKKGKLIVIDGTDGSGKATQVSLLIKRLRKEGHTVKTVDFPEYYKNFFGGFIGHCLSEQYYNWLKIHPKIASAIYAADRFESKNKIEKWLKQGCIVIANRYVSANQIHQGGKIKNTKKRNDFLNWLDNMEYRVFKIPRPNITFYLSLPVTIIEELIIERNKNQKRGYLKKKKDVHENDRDFLVNSSKSAMKLVNEVKNFIKIECSRNNQILSREEIHEMIYSQVKKFLK